MMTKMMTRAGRLFPRRHPHLARRVMPLSQPRSPPFLVDVPVSMRVMRALKMGTEGWLRCVSREGGDYYPDFESRLSPLRHAARHRRARSAERGVVPSAT